LKGVLCPNTLLILETINVFVGDKDIHQGVLFRIVHDTIPAMGTLFLVATPIGNMEDITIRALKMLLTAEYIACEDTRRAGIFLNSLHAMSVKYNMLAVDEYVKPELISYYEENELSRIPQIVTLLKNDKNLVLISDAGTPAVSDPGFKLIRECIKEGIKVESIPGASSVISALVVSGLPTDKFLFVGYPPRKPGHRKTFFQNLHASQTQISSTIVMFESPHKIERTLGDLLEVCGDIDIVICRELTKKFESKRREKISEALANYKKTPAKGELVVLFHL
jgi:16S rRNA (cytidine1402-2'-O)-methyltransferase